MRIGILQTGQSPDALRGTMGDYPDMFEKLLAGQGLEFSRWHVEAMEFPASPQDAEGWLITGSRHGAYEDHPFIAPLSEFIRAAYAEGVPMVGICFGHQIIAQALGGRVDKFPDGWAVGPHTYDFQGDPLTLNAWHQDQVVEKPEAATVIARSDFCANAALVYGDRALTIQAHPEFSDEFIRGLMEKRGRGVVPDDRIDAAEAKLGGRVHADIVARQIAEFFKQPRK